MALAINSPRVFIPVLEHIERKCTLQVERDIPRRFDICSAEPPFNKIAQNTYISFITVVNGIAFTGTTIFDVPSLSYIEPAILIKIGIFIYR